MLRAFLLASPLVLTLVSCGDSATSFDESTLHGGASSGATGGTESSGATSNVGASSSTGGKSSSAGTSSSAAGTENTSGGTESTNGGTKNTGGTAASGGTKNTGGTESTNGGTNNQSGSSNGGGGSGNGAGTDGGGSGGTAAGGGGSGGTAAGGTAGTGGNGGPTCPDVFGQYDIVNLQGACNGVNKDAPQSIQGTDMACFAHFVSVVVQGNPGVNGGGQMDENGNFTGATLYLGKTERKNCTGTWDAAEERMTVKCPVQNEFCTVTMDLK